MKLRNAQIILVLFFITPFVFSEAINLQGTVTNKNNKPIPNATLTLLGQNLKTLTDKEGKYSIIANTVSANKKKLSLFSGEYFFHSQGLTLSLKTDQHITLEIYNIQGKLIGSKINKVFKAGVNHRIPLHFDQPKPQVLTAKLTLGDKVVFHRFYNMENGIALNKTPLISHQAKKSAIAVDTLKVSASGYKSAMAPLTNYINNKQDITLTLALGESCKPNANPSNYKSIVSAASPGDLVCLSDGLYTQGLTVPDGVTIQAANRNLAEFKGGDRSWSSILIMSGTGSTIDGLKVHFPSNVNSNACQISGSNNTLRNSTCSHGGSYKHVIPLIVGGSGHLIEDSWFFGEGRYVVQCFVGDHITLRRNIARWDATAPNKPTEPNAAFSIYNCSDITIENNVSLDYGEPETPMNYGGDFYSPSNLDVYPEGNHDNHFLGNIAVNHDTNTNNNRAFRADNNANPTLTGGKLIDFYIANIQTDFVIKPGYEFEIKNCTRINVKNKKNINCGDGADISSRYIDGVKTLEPLFPFPNEDRAKADMCASGERQSKWCSFNGTLKEYIKSF